MNKRSKIVRITTAIALVVAVAVTFIMPLGYFVTSYVHIAGSLKAEAEINSRIVSTLINANPDLWRFEQLRLDELLAHRPPGGEEEIRRIFDLDGQKVAESFTPLRPPLITTTHDLKAAGVTVGRIEISRSLFPLLMTTGVTALLGLCIGLTVYLILRVLPLRAVFRAEEELRDLNELLERKIEERTRQLVKTQEELINSEKLAMLGLIAGGMGNELRNPLGVMNNAIFFLQSVMPDADETTREYLDIIKHEIDRSQRIISDVLDFYHTQTPRKKSIPSHDLVEHSLRESAIPENIQLRTEIQDLSAAVMIDPKQMDQVLRSLITNAVQAMPDGGELRIATRQAGTGLLPAREQEGRPQDMPPADFLEISVADTGKGIAPENMKRLFQPLFTTKSRGIGLGLSICKSFVEANGGQIAVSSEPGKGTTFTVSLPIAGQE